MTNNLIDFGDCSKKQYFQVDTLVHQFCKLFGASGAPEYCSGVVSFPDFLSIKIKSTSGKEQVYYQNCLKVRLHRQVGSRYFVSAANACKILFLRDAAISFLRYTGKSNKLEKDVLQKLQDQLELSHLIVDSLMYFHVYGDLYMLSKSEELGLSAFSMNNHYFELDNYLSEVIERPEIVFIQDYSVFSSEERLYSTDSKVNHRLKSQFVYDSLFENLIVDASILQPLLVKGATSMEEKLCTYAADCLPGGRYWEPEENVKDILCQLKPSNDVCESILGLNDYLTTALPNLHQMSRTNLVQVKKNRTMTWLSHLPAEKQAAVIDMAVKQRRQVKQICNDEHTARVEHRRQAMINEHAKREGAKKKLSEEKEKLSKLHLIALPQELEEEMVRIDLMDVSTAKKNSLKISTMKTQIQIRKKVLAQTLPITFTSNRKQRPVGDILRELTDFVTESSARISPEILLFLKQPTKLIGKRIKQRFEDESGDSESWYSGTVIDYQASDKTHSIKFEGEDDVCIFDLTIDFLNGDIVVN